MSGFEARFKQAVGGINPWIPLFVFVALFQYFRGATLDTIYFLTVAVILLIDWKASFPFSFPARPRIKPFTVGATLVILGAALYLTPLHGPLEVALMIGVFFLAIGIAWHKDSGPRIRRTKSLNRSKWAWITIGVLVCLWELFAYILSDIASDAYAYPTISILLGPFVSDPIGRAVFVGLWLWVGALLSRKVISK